MVERQFGKHVKTIRSDNGSEFLCLNGFFRACGIIHETSCVGTPQQNGRVERKHRHILNVARALRFQASLPLEFWGQCILAAGYLINRTPATTIDGKTPFHMLYKRSPPMTHLRVFGCLCYVHNQNTKGDKFASRSKPSIFLGYPFGKKGWRVFDLETRKITVSRDVIFLEDQFPFATPTPSSSPSILSPALRSTFGHSDFDTDDFETDPVVEILAEPTTPTSAATHSQPVTPMASPPTAPPSPSSIMTTPASALPELTPSPALGRGLRPKSRPSHLNDYVLATMTSSTVPVSPTINPSCWYPIEDYVDCERFSPSHCAYLTAITKIPIPKHYSQAVLVKQFREAMRTEVDALDEQQTWTVEKLPPGKKAIGSKWVYTIKYRSDGSLERYKARLVVLGNNQIEGVDFEETFAPVIKMNTVRIFLEVAASKNWEVHQMDVHNAFLHGDLDEEVFMKPPPGFRTNDPSQVCRLHKSLYGLRQAPRCWFAKLTSALLDYGFTQNISDYSLFNYAKSGEYLHVLVYVDDLVISGSSPSLSRKFKEYLSSCFKMKDLGELKYFLGIEVARSSKGIYLSQRKYALDIISEVGLLGAKPVAFPIDQNHNLTMANGEDMPNSSRYRRLVGRLIYLATTRPDLSYAIHILTRYMKHPKDAHWEAALRVVRFLKGNPGQGILLRADSPLQLTSWCDSDWAGCRTTRRSLTGYFIQLGNSPVSWKTHKQRTVSLSSAEAEYRALQYTTRELIWIKALLLSLGIDHSDPIPLHCDSKAAIHIATNPVFHERTKHIETDCHFVRQAIQRGIITTRHVGTKMQLADIMTKALGRAEFDSFVSKMGICDLHAPS